MVQRLEVCLIVPPRPYLLNQKALPSLGVLLAGAVFKACGCNVKVLDFADGERFEEADLYGVTCTTPDFDEAVKILRRIKDFNPKAKVIVGGPHATTAPLECLKAGFDIVASGDAEWTVPLILQGFKGIIHGQTHSIDSYHPDRSLLDLWSYDFKVGSLRATPLMTSRGCVWGKCAFCSRIERGVRYHSVTYVVQELIEVSRLGFKAVAVYDDEFFTHPRRDREIVEALADRGFIWRCFGRSDFILKSAEIVEAAARGGLVEVLLGVESGDDTILETIEKGITVEQNVEAIRLLHSLGVRVKAAMIVGLPGESEETLRNTERFCEQVAPFVSDWDFTILQVYPGSAIFNHPFRYDLNWTASYEAYKGMYAEGWKPSPISTSKLSFEKLMEWRDRLEARFKKGWKPPFAKGW
ncbi:MAG: radical SAM protein [Candidatus Bathyarchaeia archaeon]